jgi:predicted DNA-binding transcriptional regulator YafY
MCRYFDWNASKEKVYKHNHSYVFSPYGLAWSNDRYYAVGWSDSHAKIITLRVDRIADAKLTEYAAAPKPDGFKMSYYGEIVINMHDGELRNVILRCENNMMKHIIDRFGENVATEVISAEKFVACVRVPTSPTFFAWVFTFGGAIRITAPDDVANSYREMLTKAMH